MKQHGYFLASIGKTVTLKLWSADLEQLKKDKEEFGKKNDKIYPSYKSDDGKAYIEVDGQLLRIQ